MDRRSTPTPPRHSRHRPHRRPGRGTPRAVPGGGLVSIEAIHWALTAAPIPRDRRDASSLAIVLVGLANHADPDGRNAFPSLRRLTRYTRLSERSVRYALRTLEDLGVIRPSDPNIVAAYVKRADRRPNGYDLSLEQPEPVDNPPDDRQPLPPVPAHEGQSPQQRGATSASTRGKPCPRNILNHPKNLPPDADPLRPPCGSCDARPHDPPSARLIWSNDDPTRAIPCPRCHPRAITPTGELA
ncbi:helix-turn-helix domain-containing protein [Actinokineospora sp. HUAS TT18]|uniref:helix-turn-helix domain-containing protein n=1 Tax=Actinokineospora sp. HUAS TT18 TaxID=3447451 RepID=UPI003F51D28F